MTCTPNSSAVVMATGSTSMSTLLLPEFLVNLANPRMATMVNEDLMTIGSTGGLVINVTTSGDNFRLWIPHVGGGGDPMPIIDVLFCRQLGIDPPTPSSCNSGVIGNRQGTSYHAALRFSWECWASGGTGPDCPSSIDGYVPGDLFALAGLPSSGTPISLGMDIHAVLEMLPKCSP